MAEYLYMKLTAAENQCIAIYLVEMRGRLPIDVTYDDLWTKLYADMVYYSQPLYAEVVHYSEALRSREIDLEVTREWNYSNTKTIEESIATYQRSLVIAIYQYQRWLVVAFWACFGLYDLTTNNLE
ncbi:MAG: hypothetical protein Q9222_007247 [Ikaeria aurantiellina]